MITVAKAQITDLDAVAALESIMFSDAMSRHVLESSVDNDLFLVLRDQEAVIGYFLGQIVLDEMEFLRIAVKPEYRRRGCARMLLQMVKQEALERKVDKCFLEVRESNCAAIALYKTSGFLQYGRRTRFYRNPDEDAILMKAQWSVESL